MAQNGGISMTAHLKAKVGGGAGGGGDVSRAKSVRGVRGGVLTKLRGFERIAEDTDLSSLALRLRKEERPADNETSGKIVIYTTSMKAVRDTHAECIKVTRLFGALRVKFDLKDVFIHPDFMEELQERVGDLDVTVPQVFINGDHIGDGEMVLDMNETGELTALLKGFQRTYIADCSDCGGKRFVACLLCQGSKKGKRSSFGTLKCTQCNQHALQPCPTCSGGATANALKLAEQNEASSDDVIAIPRTRAMTAPSRVKPGKLDVSNFESKSQPRRDSASASSMPKRQPKPLRPSSLSQFNAPSGSADVKADVKEAVDIGEVRVKDKARVFESAPSDEDDDVIDQGVEETDGGTTSKTASQHPPGSSALPPEEDFAKRSRMDRIRFALEVARSTEDDDTEPDTAKAPVASPPDSAEASATGSCSTAPVAIEMRNADAYDECDGDDDDDDENSSSMI